MRAVIGQPIPWAFLDAPANASQFGPPGLRILQNLSRPFLPPPPSLPREKNRRASNGVGDRGIRPHRRQPPRLRCPIPGSGTSPRLSLLLPLLVHPLSSYSLPSLLRLAPRSRETEERPGRPPPPLVGDASPPSTSPIAPQVNLRRFPTLRCPHLLFFLLWFGRLAP